MKSPRLERQLRKELLILQAEACRAEIRREGAALAARLLPRGSGNRPSWTEHPLLQTLLAGSSAPARWLRWGLLVWRWWPTVRTVWAAARAQAANPSAADAPADASSTTPGTTP